MVDHVHCDAILITTAQIKVAQYEAALFNNFTVLDSGANTVTEVDKIIAAVTMKYRGCIMSLVFPQYVA